MLFLSIVYKAIVMFQVLKTQQTLKGPVESNQSQINDLNQLGLINRHFWLYSHSRVTGKLLLDALWYICVTTA